MRAKPRSRASTGEQMQPPEPPTHQASSSTSIAAHHCSTQPPPQPTPSTDQGFPILPPQPRTDLLVYFAIWVADFAWKIGDLRAGLKQEQGRKREGRRERVRGRRKREESGRLLLPLTAQQTGGSPYRAAVER